MSLHLDNLKIEKESGNVNIPLSEINSILIDSYNTQLTVRLLSRLSEYKILLIVCDISMTPIGIYSTFNGHHRGYKIQRNQIDSSEKVKGEIWQIIVKNKLLNQKLVLEKFTDNKENRCISDLNYIQECSDSVEFYDSTNREGIGARLYFKKMFGDSFSRNDDSISTNSFLNFGYAIIRSSFCRAISLYGLNPSLGIFHRNEFNSFNLADDLMEIYRPIIDEYVFNNYKYKESFERNDKFELINVLNHYILHDGEKINISSSIEKYVLSYVKCIENADSNLLNFPNINIIEKYEL